MKSPGLNSPGMKLGVEKSRVKMSCNLIVDVFARLRFGDRFFYDLKGQVGSFEENQLDQIRQASMARLICDNTKIDKIQPMAFRLADEKM